MYKRSEQSWLKHLDFILLDVFSAQLAYVLAYAFRFGVADWVYSEEIYRTLAIWLALFSVVIAVMFNTMRDVLKRRWRAEVRQTLTQGMLVFGVTVVYLFSIKESELYSRKVLWTTLLLYIPLSFALRMLWKRLMRHWLRDERQRAVLLIASEVRAVETIGHLKSHALESLSLSGLVLTDRDATGEKIEGVSVVASLEEAARFICREWIDEVCVSIDDITPQTLKLLDACKEMGVTVHLWTRSLGTGKQVLEKLAGMPVYTSSINVISPAEKLIKRVIDLLGGVVLAVVAVAAILILAPIIKRKSPGPVLYRQERIGQNGRKFKMYKIRSMYMDADERKQELMGQNRVSDGRMFKMDFDPRVIGNEVLPDGRHKTGVGEFIRRYSIDELPQAFNLLLGNMSLVGTRPPTVDEWEKYELHHRARLAVKPGITGMWQVQGRSKITDFEEITRLDTYYIANWSFALDLRILFKTIWVVLQRKGAM